jgi:uncharacterized protein (DUF1501 family)
LLIQRRDFIKTGAFATASLWIPQFLQTLEARPAIAPKGKILVVLQLSGGNDGLNTVIPYRNDIYYRERPRIGIKRENALRLTDDAGLHPTLQGLKSLYDNGEMAVLNSVGYPNPDRSHFRSMDIWHSASPANEYWNTGWLGRYLDAQCHPCERPVSVVELDDTLSLALKGDHLKGMAFEDPKRLYESARDPFFAAVSQAHGRAHDHDDALPANYLYKTLASSLSSADYLYEQSRRKQEASYPATGLGKNFKTIASLILSDTDTTVYYLSHGSFDTHINQEGQQKRLFQEMNDALAAFASDLKANGRWKDVLVVTFSEFGRRVSQNASGGTDHGTANNMLFLGGALRQPGLLNALPDLTRLNDDDLIYSVDFRQVYATLLQRWLQADTAKVLPGWKADGLLGFV